MKKLIDKSAFSLVRLAIVRGGMQGSRFSVFLYDSVYLWAKTVDDVISMDRDPRDGALVLSLAKTHVFQGTAHHRLQPRSH